MNPLMHLAQYLHNNSFGVVDETIWYGEIPFEKEGIGLVEIGGTSSQSQILVNFDIISRGNNRVNLSNQMWALWKHFSTEQICNLPAVVDGCCPDPNEIQGVSIKPLGSIVDAGLDDTGLQLYRWSYQLNYII